MRLDTKSLNLFVADNKDQYVLRFNNDTLSAEKKGICTTVHRFFCGEQYLLGYINLQIAPIIERDCKHIQPGQGEVFNLHERVLSKIDKIRNKRFPLNPLKPHVSENGKNVELPTDADKAKIMVTNSKGEFYDFHLREPVIPAKRRKVEEEKSVKREKKMLALQNGRNELQKAGVRWVENAAQNAPKILLLNPTQFGLKNDENGSTIAKVSGNKLRVERSGVIDNTKVILVKANGDFKECIGAQDVEIQLGDHILMVYGSMSGKSAKEMQEICEAGRKDQESRVAQPARKKEDDIPTFLQEKAPTFTKAKVKGSKVVAKCIPAPLSTIAIWQPDQASIKQAEKDLETQKNAEVTAAKALELAAQINSKPAHVQSKGFNENLHENHFSSDDDLSEQMDDQESSQSKSSGSLPGLIRSQTVFGGYIVEGREEKKVSPQLVPSVDEPKYSNPSPKKDALSAAHQSPPPLDLKTLNTAPSKPKQVVKKGFSTGLGKIGF